MAGQEGHPLKKVAEMCCNPRINGENASVESFALVMMRGESSVEISSVVI
jgi:hypothetical protein